MAADSVGSTPTPDPTTLTTEQMLREIKNQRERFDEQITNVEEKADLRMTDLANRIKHGQDVHDERFLSVAQQFAERDGRATDMKTASERAIEAALQAAKELVEAQRTNQREAQNKSEAAVTEQIKAQALRIEEIKERIDRENGYKVGGTDTTEGERAERAERRASTSLMIAAVSIIITVVTVADAFLGR